MIDVMVKLEDSTRVNRIVERFEFSDVSQSAQIKSDIEKTLLDKKIKQALQKDIPNKDENSKIMEDILKAPIQKEVNSSNPELAKTTKSRQSEPTLKPNAGEPKLPKPSVKKELKEIKAEKDKEAKLNISEKEKAKTTKPTQHIQPKKKNKKKER